MPPTIQSGLTSVVVVIADSGPLAMQCVARVLAGAGAFEVILVDNASRDGQAEAISAQHRADPRLRVLHNAENIGFGPACNRGAALAQGDALLFLNPDCLIEVDTLQRLRQLMLDHRQAGLIGVFVSGADGSPERAIRRRDPSLRRSLMSLSGLARFQHRWPALAGIEMPASANSVDVERVEAVSGACMFMPQATYDAVAGFDEAYFLHCEDLDLCRRVRGSGYEVLFASSIKVRHEQGSSSRSRPLFVSRHKHRSMWLYFRRFDPAAGNPLLRALVACGIWAHYAAFAPVKGWREWRRQGNPRAGIIP